MDLGAHFYRSDFQVHTPRDRQWGGDGAVTGEARRAYAQEFVAACRRKGLNAVAITDHHDLAFFRWIKEAALAETDDAGEPLPQERRLVVFPGMELTLGVPCQALLILDADFPTGLLEQVVQALSVTPSSPEEEFTAATSRLEHFTELQQLHDELDRRDFLKGRFIILPHVGEGGNSTLLRSAFTAKYKGMPCVGGFVDGAITQHGNGNKSILEGKDKAWGSKALGLFQTSDCRHRNLDDLGTHSTWVKWAKPTAEALRQACLARQSRLSQTEPSVPTVVITSIEVSNSKFLGPIQLELNPQYNALIGGRGTGKSTILEYLRWGLCDQPPGEMEDGQPNYQQRRQSLIANTLDQQASVTISFTKNGIPHVVRRRVNGGQVLLKIGAGDLAPCTEADVRTLLPIQAYSQKQLSHVGVRLEELSRFIHTPIKAQLDELEGRREQLRSALRAAYADLTRHRTLTADLAALDLERLSLGDQLTSLRAGLKGLSEEERRVIDSEAQYEQEDRTIEAWEAELKRLSEVLSEAEEELQPFPAALEAGETPNLVTLQGMRVELDALFTRVRGQLRTAQGSITDGDPTFALVGFSKALAEWRVRREFAKAAYAAAKANSATQQGTLQQIKAAETRLKQVDTLLGEKKRALQVLGEPTAKFAELKNEWRRLHEAGSTLTEAECRRLTELSKGFIRAALLRAHRVEGCDELLRNALRGAKLRSAHFEALWARVRGAAQPIVEWHAALDELEALRRVPPGDGPIMLPSTPILESAGFTTQARTFIARTLTTEDWLALLLRDLDDLPEFEYRSREGDYIDFALASAGQQATALMYVLLNQGGPPLVVDQPEDDLDNTVMREIVEEIWAAKAGRQLIFSSHNANLVVNGDAELVVCCDYRIAGDQSGGRIKCQGAIDIPEINSEITTVMEGGRQAFALRREKYGF